MFDLTTPMRDSIIELGQVARLSIKPPEASVAGDVQSFCFCFNCDDNILVLFIKFSSLKDSFPNNYKN